jgi:hypothetical protein
MESGAKAAAAQTLCAVRKLLGDARGLCFVQHDEARIDPLIAADLTYVP